ncbi:MAG: ABC transporter substrate-binding protein [Thermoleophilia bacterium]|nr:ABC transporter substrate-binding protein [Thermoleophilia bacterium]
MTSCRTVGTLRRPVQRIVSLAPSLTETLFHLQLGSSVVGMTEQCDTVEAAGVERIGGFSTPDTKRILDLRTDLVLGLDHFHSRVAGELAEAGVPAMLFNYPSVEEIFAAMEEIVRAADAVRAASPLVQALRDRVSRVRSAAGLRKGPRVFRLMTDDPIITPADVCFQTDAIRLAGGTTMELDFAESYVSVRLDEVLEFDPQVVLSCGIDSDAQEPKERCRGCKAVTRSCRRDVRELAKRPGWSSTSAAANGWVRAMTCGLLCRPGPRTVGAIEVMAEMFKESMQAQVAPQDAGR